MGWARLVPELVVKDLSAALRFWCDLLGFEVVYDRPREGFAYLDRDGAQIMLEQHAQSQRQWLTGPPEPPLGRGINLQIEVAAVAPNLRRLEQASWPLFMACEAKWYAMAECERGQLQFLVQDPDGYLIRLAESLGERPVA
jgi:catechol 2,3-dioxygenase-like lactoylglutathione lyase family enzyme